MIAEFLAHADSDAFRDDSWLGLVRTEHSCAHATITVDAYVSDGDDNDDDYPQNWQIRCRRLQAARR
jgi:hypothetical protein